MSLDVGDPVRVLMTKWPDRPHAEFVGTWLGADAHGDWVGARAGTPCTRAGADYPATADWVTLLALDAWWRAAFYDPPPGLDVYVDIATPCAWNDAAVTCVDLDLDVVRRVPGGVGVEDEAEFAAHAPGYPDDLVAGARSAVASVRADLEAARPPYDGSHAPWLASLRARVPG